MGKGIENPKQYDFAGEIRKTQFCSNCSANVGLANFFVGQCGFEFYDPSVPEVKGPGSRGCGLEVQGLI